MFSVSIMAHPSRKNLIPNLVESLKPTEPKIAWDEINNIWHTCRRAWLQYNPEADFHLVLQDDSVIGKDFHSRLNHLLEYYPGQVFSLYIGNRKKFKREVDLLRPKGGIIIKQNIHHEIALVFPTKRIPEMIKFCDGFNPDTDKIINKYVTANQLNVFIPVPTLIDHLNVPSLHNLNQSDVSYRKSIWFVGEAI